MRASSETIAWSSTSGTKYRLVVALKYSAQIAFIRFVGTHAEYDDVDVEEV
jgi:mRNA interferase HigB